MKLHELKILHEYLIDVSKGKKTFELRKNDRDYHLFHEKTDIEPYIDENTLYRITYVLKNVSAYGLDKNYCILSIKKLNIKKE